MDVSTISAVVRTKVATISGRLTLGGTALDTELVAFRVGHDDPAPPVGQPLVVHNGCPDPDQPLYLFIAGTVGGLHVKVDSVFARLVFWNADEQ